MVDWLLFIASFPFLCMFTWTIPNCSKAHNRKYFLVSFFASIVWIAILSFGMVTLVGRVGCILNIDKFTMGLVVVAIGTSIPVSHVYYASLHAKSRSTSYDSCPSKLSHSKLHTYVYQSIMCSTMIRNSTMDQFYQMQNCDPPSLI